MLATRPTRCVERYATSWSTQLTLDAQILAAAIARIYVAHPDPSAWRYTGLEGAMVFGNTSRGRGGFWLKLVDIVVRGRATYALLTSTGHSRCNLAA